MSALTSFEAALAAYQEARHAMARARKELLADMGEARYREENGTCAIVTEVGGDPDISRLSREALAALITDPLVGDLVELRPCLKGWKNATHAERAVLWQYAPAPSPRKKGLVVKKA